MLYIRQISVKYEVAIVTEQTLYNIKEKTEKILFKTKYYSILELLYFILF